MSPRFRQLRPFADFPEKRIESSLAEKIEKETTDHDNRPDELQEDIFHLTGKDRPFPLPPRPTGAGNRRHIAPSRLTPHPSRIGPPPLRRPTNHPRPSPRLGAMATDRPPRSRNRLRRLPRHPTRLHRRPPARRLGRHARRRRQPRQTGGSRQTAGTRRPGSRPLRPSRPLRLRRRPTAQHGHRIRTQRRTLPLSQMGNGRL